MNVCSLPLLETSDCDGFCIRLFLFAFVVDLSLSNGL